jgi:vacuolar-type H+-ATPase subunit E/Vma4
VTALAERTRAALDPLRDALLADARAEARSVEASAEADGSELLESARRQRETVLQEARARGGADGAMRLQAERARIQREARRLVLAAQREAYEELRRQAIVAVGELLAEPAQRARLTQALRARLGEETDVRSQPDGGLVGRSRDGRAVDGSAEAAVDAVLAVIDLQPMWEAT